MGRDREDCCFYWASGEVGKGGSFLVAFVLPRTEAILGGRGEESIT